MNVKNNDISIGICANCKNIITDKVEKKYLPFCSKRCKMIDLGQWLSEKYAIATNEPTEIIPDEQEE